MWDGGGIEVTKKEIKELRELNDKNATNQVGFRRSTTRGSTLDVFATQLQVQRMEAKILRAMAATVRNGEKEEMAPPAYRQEDKAATERVSISQPAWNT